MVADHQGVGAQGGMSAYPAPSSGRAVAVTLARLLLPLPPRGERVGVRGASHRNKACAATPRDPPPRPLPHKGGGSRSVTPYAMALPEDGEGGGVDWLTKRGNTMKRPLRQDKSRKGGRAYDLKPFVAIQRVQLPPGRGEPASRKRALHGWWQHHS